MDLQDFGENVDKKRITRSRNNVPLAAPNDKSQDKNSELTFNLCQWGVYPNNIFKAETNTVKQLPSAFYFLTTDQNDQICFNFKELITDDLLILDDTLKQMSNEIQTFWTKKDIFRQYGFCHRRGYLFYGRAGTGKSSIVKLIINNIIQEGGIAFSGSIINPSFLSISVQVFRSIEPNRKLVCVFEDIDAIIETYGEDSILSLLDGENLTDNVLNIATTNYPERLDKRIVSRPRRFDRIIKVEEPNADVRRKYFIEKLNLNESELEEYVKISEGFTFASLSDLVISTKCFDLSLSEALHRLRNLEKSKSSDEYYSSKTGF